MLLIFCLLLTPIIEKTSATLYQPGLSDELRSIHQEIDFLRSENQDQNKEIALLKEMVTESHQIIPEKAEKMKNHLSRRVKRPYRLLPISDSKNEKDAASGNINNQHQEVQRFYGPPTSCSELSKLGFTLNGFYLVMQPSSTSLMDDIAQLDTVYCAFKQPKGTFEASKVEKRFITQMKLSSSENESIQRQSRINDTEIKFEAFSPKDGYNWGDNFGFLPFEIVLNSGNAIDSWGIFTAPRPGDYQFFFQCKLAAKNKNFEIEANTASKLETSFIFMKNGEVGEYINVTGLSVSKETVFKLEPGDKINIYNTNFVDYEKSPVHRDIKVGNYFLRGFLLKND